MNTPTRLALSALTGAALLLGPAVAWADEADPNGPCPQGAVTVVVDASEIGGDLRVGCALEAGTGTEALLAAGFADVRDEAGMICAIDARPDPCPAEFTGQYWSYWYAEDGAWQMWTEGSDTAEVSPGAVEGWRYGDGAAGPSAAPDELPAADAAPAQTTETAETAETAFEGGLPAWVLVVAGIGLIGLLASVAVRLGKRRDGHGPAGQD